MSSTHNLEYLHGKYHLYLEHEIRYPWCYSSPIISQFKCHTNTLLADWHVIKGHKKNQFDIPSTKPDAKSYLNDMNVSQEGGGGGG